MSEKVLIQKRARERLLTVSDGCAFISGFMISALPFAINWWLLFLLFSFFYVRKRKEIVIYSAALIGGTFYFHQNQLIEVVLVSGCVSVWMLMMQLFKRPSYKTLPWFLMLISGGVAYAMNEPVSKIIVLMLGQFILAQDTYKDCSWIRKELQLPDAIYGALIFIVGYLLMQILEQEYFALLIFVFMLMSVKPAISILFYLYLEIMLPGVMSPVAFGFLLLVSLLQDQPLAMNGLMLAGIAAQGVDFFAIVQGLVLLLLFDLLRNSELPFKGMIPKMALSDMNRIAVMNRQLNNFSVIFENLADYYASLSEVESEMLQTMAKALSYTASNCTRHQIDVEKRKDQLLDFLDGYKIDVVSCLLEENEEGCIYLELELKDFPKEEAEATLLPLLNHVLPTRMELVEKKNNRNYSGIFHYSFISSAPIMIDAYADSIRHETQACGDSFSIFRYSRFVLCMISDGMGSGEAASRISRSITAIFQRMIASNIPQVEAIRCINKLILSDNYATFDVLNFDRFKKTVTVSKSAACPTYLIRDDEVYEINGSSLPVGIVASIEVDSIHVEVEKGDWFLMSSDGIYVDEIYRWIHQKRLSSAKEEVDVMMEILREKERADDSTVLLAQIK